MFTFPFTKGSEKIKYQYTKLLLLMTIKYSLDLNQGHDETKYVILGFRSLILLVLQAGTLSVEGTRTLLKFVFCLLLKYLRHTMREIV